MKKSSKQAGDWLEAAIFEIFRAEIEDDRFLVKRDHCKVFLKKGYYSKDRGSKIVFDVSIEFFLSGATDYSMLWLIECKNYSSSVPVDDAEEFFSKVEQVGAANAKAVLASTASFQSGTRTFAKSKGMGLLRYFDASNYKWELHRSPSASARTSDSNVLHTIDEALSRDSFESDIFDLYLQSPLRQTTCLWDFAEDMLSAAHLTSRERKAICHPRSRLAPSVPFLEKEAMEAAAMEVLDDIGYKWRAVPLEDICERERKRTGLATRTGVVPGEREAADGVLGRLRFDPLEIEIFARADRHDGRDRFTLAHELAHHLLCHGSFMSQEACDEGDFLLRRPGLESHTDIARMEFQANYFAGSLLMPRVLFVEDFCRALRELDLLDRGFGALFVDNQLCNVQSYEAVMKRLTQKYQVSRAAATIRLEGLGLLKDARAPQSALPIGLAVAEPLERWIDRADDHGAFRFEAEGN